MKHEKMTGKSTEHSLEDSGTAKEAEEIDLIELIRQKKEEF